MARRPRPQMAWNPEPEERLHFEQLLDLDPSFPVVSDRYTPDRSQSITVRIPAALQERLDTVAWELRAPVSELVRGILWDAFVRTAAFVDVDMAEDEPVGIVIPPREVG